MMLNPELEYKYIKYKEDREHEVDKQWQGDMEKLYKKPKVRFFKNVLDPRNQFQKSGRGTLVPPVDVLGTNPRGGPSWVLDYKKKGNNKNMKLLPYDLVIK